MKMPSEAPVLPSQPEKPHHYTYLKGFRTEQCPLFLQHKCTQHRPFTCFHWHFQNQRRRRPVRRRDGTFNYSADKYCTKYDETTGVCPNGDDCQWLHRTAGDTERRYHLRYYKTASCVHDTDSKGYCTKNGPHCAFAHGSQDQRTPTYDVREIQAMEHGEASDSSSTDLSSSLEKERSINDDPKWNDTNFVLANYKTEPCKRPPRLCRQGYACPQYHNNRDRRRNPQAFKYRSTPCPQVKQNDEWGDPSVCDSGDNCQYCHTRTEQQFHPEIYKSTKCNDMMQTGYCPRGPFCAFAHVEQEMQLLREVLESPKANSLAAFMPTSLKTESINGDHKADHENNNSNIKSDNDYKTTPQSEASPDLTSPTNQLPEPIGKGRTSSVSEYHRTFSGDKEESGTFSLPKLNNEHDLESKTLHQSIGAQNFCLTNNNTGMSPLAMSFFPPAGTVESVLGNAIDDLTFEDLNLSYIDKEVQDPERDTASVNSSMSAGLSTSYLGTSLTTPMSINNSSDTVMQGNLSQTPPSPLGSLPMFINPNTKPPSHLDQAFLGQSTTGTFTPFGSDLSYLISPRSVQQSQNNNNGSMHSPLANNSNEMTNDNQRLKDELNLYKAKLAKCDENISRARSACEIWKREADDANRRAKDIEEEKKVLLRQRDEAVAHAAQIKRDLENTSASSYLRTLKPISELGHASISQLRQLQQQLCIDLEQINQLIANQAAVKCIVCQNHIRAVTLVPCNHSVLCESCSSKASDCPVCHTRIQHRTNVIGQVAMMK